MSGRLIAFLAQSGSSTVSQFILSNSDFQRVVSQETRMCNLLDSIASSRISDASVVGHGGFDEVLNSKLSNVV